jgi:hypothetical protein
MPEQISICVDAGRLTIQVLGYENPAAENEDDANWLSCRLVLTVGPFHADLAVSFTTCDFPDFLRELKSAYTQLSGAASFQTLEDAVRLDIRVEPSGKAQVSGIVQVANEAQAALSFSYGSDQSFLGQTLQELEAVVQQFPTLEFPGRH